MQLTIKERIEHKYPSLSKGQKRLADYILTEYDKAAFMTASRLGEQVRTSESTVVRFSLALGYEGYPQLQKALQELIRNKLTTLQRMELTGEMNSDFLQSVLKADMNNIRLTMENISMDHFGQAVGRILEANHIYIIGLRSSALLADYLGHYLNFLLPNITIVSGGSRDVFEQLLRAGKGDVLIGITFPRYSSRTIEAAEFAVKKGCTVIALTDSETSPLAKIAQQSLIAISNMTSIVDSLVAPLSVINALIVAVSMKRREETAKYFQELESIWEKYSVYTNQEKLSPNMLEGNKL